jgi:esterase/lipase superfamily enzyme
MWVCLDMFWSRACSSAVALLWLLAAGLGAATLSGCSARPPVTVLAPVAQVPGFTPKVRILVATTRERASPEEGSELTARRAGQMNYDSITISIPSRHQVGRIEWPDAVPPQPGYSFMTTERAPLDRAGFLGEIAAQTRQGGSESNQVLLYVHGYNTLYQEAVYRLAQIVHDSKFTGTAVLFAWPSRGKTPLYLADRESSEYSRDYLEAALLEIAAIKGVRSINVLGHSMGNMLVMETLRQAKLKGHGNFRGKLGEVILAAPDIDVQVFRTQLDVVTPLAKPITVLVSQDDQALAIARTLAGGVDRVGAAKLDDPAIVAGIARYNLRVIDMSGLSSGDNSNHNKFAQSGVVIEAMGRGFANDGATKAGDGGVVQALTDVGNSLINLPTAAAGLPPVTY